MLRPFAFSVVLEGLLPRYRPPRRPAPLVWEHRIYANRLAAELHEVTARLTRCSHGSGATGAVFVQSGTRETETAAEHTGLTAAIAVQAG
jgi:hypothetical protein